MFSCSDIWAGFITAGYEIRMSFIAFICARRLFDIEGWVSICMFFVIERFGGSYKFEDLLRFFSNAVRKGIFCFFFYNWIML